MYEGRLAKILADHSTALAASLDETVAYFYQGLDQDPSSHRVLSILSQTERLRLNHAQVEHLRLLIDPEVDPLQLKAAAERAGEMHAIIGVPASSLVNAFGLYLRKVSQAILALPSALIERSTLLHIISLRIQSDLQWQMERIDAHQARIDRVEQTLINVCQSDLPWADVIRGVLDAFLEIPGITGSGFMRHGAQQEFVAEFISGDYDRYWDAIQRHDTDLKLSGMARCFIKAAHEQKPVKVPNFAQHEFETLRVAAAEAGVRSAISVPLLEHSKQTLPVLCLTSPYPNTFNALPLSRIIQGVVPHLNAAYRRAAELRESVAGISYNQRRFYRSLLTRGGLVMFYQPIVDLVTGTVIKVEALARLQLPDGRILSPAHFLPWFGQSELGELFSRGLLLALGQLADWDRQGLKLRLNINLPPEILVHPQCPNWVSLALQQTGISANRLHLELLESQAPQNQELRDHAINRLSQIGLKLDMDDLGSGYSSLQRLHLMPFAGIKVDQEIMRGCLEGSSKALGIANSVTTLGRDLELSVVIEGLENQGLIEVAAILGAHKGQGYGIARPMPASELMPWIDGWSLQIAPASPKTALGTWAKFWRWQRLGRYAQPNQQDSPTCGIGNFVRQHGLQGSDLDHAHQAMHKAIADADHHTAQQHVSWIEDHLINLIVTV